MRLADHVDPKRLKELNLLLLLEGAKEVGGGAELRKRTRERAKMIRDDTLQGLLDEVLDVPRSKARKAWSHWMALVTIRQPFFDANHRTALAAFNHATAQEWDFEFVLSRKDLEELMRGSRALVKAAHKPSDAAPRTASMAALRDVAHPARKFYRGFEPKLVERPLP